ncbi:hypothetical protein B0J11DRAFT_531766 [Dendryphion nanum]|uniref:Secreted protein n=1 Tax=Dendryphion nanum TaxID=256645 RepID=A0A9P9DN33_9PLEO|nr:hypothetical protein B0J11DRAFT_531766 [Dendryphion nanum]
MPSPRSIPSWSSPLQILFPLSILPHLLAANPPSPSKKPSHDRPRMTIKHHQGRTPPWRTDHILPSWSALEPSALPYVAWSPSANPDRGIRATDRAEWIRIAVARIGSFVAKGWVYAGR